MNPFHGSELELEQKIDSFKLQHLQKQRYLERNEEKLQDATNEQRKLTKNVEETDRKYHSLIQKGQDEQDLYDVKAKHISQLCKDMKITVDFDIKNDNRRAAGLVTNIRSSLTAEKAKIQEILENNQIIDADQELEIREYREQEIKIKSELESVGKRLKESEKILSEKKAELRMIKQSDKKLDEVRRNIAKIKEFIVQLEANSNTQAIQNEISQYRDEKRTVAAELDDINEQITVISSMANIVAEVTTKEKQIEKRKSEVRRIKNKHYDNLQRLFPDETIESNFKKRIDTINQKLITEVNKLEAEIRLKENHIQTFKAQMASKRQELTNMESEQRKLETEIYRLCEQTPFDAVLTTTKENVAKLQMEHSSYKSSDVFYKKYIKKMQDQPCCPLCQKEMNRGEVDFLTIELNDQIEMLPDNIIRSEREFEKENMKLEKLLGLQNSVERVGHLESNLIPKVKDDIKKVGTDLLAAQEKIKQSTLAVEEPREKKAMIAGMIGDMSILDEAIRDIEQTQTDMAPLKQSLPANDGPNDFNLESLQKKRVELNNRSKQLDKEIERKEKRSQEDLKKIGSCKEKKIELERTELQMQSEIQNLESLKAREKELSETINELTEKQEGDKKLLIPILGKIKHAEEKRANIKADGAEALSQASKRFDELKRHFDSIERVSKDLERLAAENLEHQIKVSNDELTRLRCELKEQVISLHFSGFVLE